ncbi:MAG: S46 family peptidase [Sphingobacteriales bacterium]|nr:S46 family peptidase [Sphingobacteriales bacterium]
MKKVILGFIAILFLSVQTKADEGMWLPQLLQTLNEKEMRKMGMKLHASDIYNINKSSLKDAIVSLGGFCTAEVISDKGLILTNHHCGFDAIQNHSTLENNYIKNGFWAANNNSELTNPGLFVSFIINIEDYTNQVLSGVSKELSEKDRQTLIEKNIAEIKKEYKKETYQDIIVRSFFDGNKYYLFVTETYKDVRLVGAPPASIGNFGKDTDNWMWPIHTGDFSMFRIYADKNNKPASYSPDNVPYVPKRSLNISLKGLKENDFTMVMGFPGRTNEYLPSYAIKQIMEISNPAKIKIRHQVLDVMGTYMRKDELIKIKYAAKYANIENAYKKWQGELLGLQKSNGIKKKLDYETKFKKLISNNAKWQNNYGHILNDLSKAYGDLEPLIISRDYFNEIVPRIELFNLASAFNGLFKSYTNDSASNNKKNQETIEKVEDILKEYDHAVDKKLFTTLLDLYIKDQNSEFISPKLLELINVYKEINKVADYIYTNSKLTNIENIKTMFENNPMVAMDSIKNDPAFLLYLNMYNTYIKETSSYVVDMQGKINKLQRNYMQAQLTVFSNKRFYPDANSTLRVTYGKVKGYAPKDAVKYNFYTYMDGIMEKYKPGDYEFDLPQKLIDLYNAKDFGQYGVNGKQPVCFIATNHTTGGNSGSPALDANGNLVGLNFDRVWEGTMSDINYDPTICRNVMVDIRYVLFIIDKFAGAHHLIKEMKLVRK